jgi:hypothetical protein
MQQQLLENSRKASALSTSLGDGSVGMPSISEQTSAESLHQASSAKDSVVVVAKETVVKEVVTRDAVVRDGVVAKETVVREVITRDTVAREGSSEPVVRETVARDAVAVVRDEERTNAVGRELETW